jgi:arylsulfatase A-like enzyme
MADRPNFIIILTDDLGYGDLGCYGSPTIRTPQLDRMASEGLRFTDFYAPAEVCTPSRAALLTGRYAIRSGMAGSRRVLYPGSKGGLPPGEITIAEALRPKGYATMHIGKWHLGIHEGSRPQDQGFDHTFGIPYSNDMDARAGLPQAASSWPNPPRDGWNVPLQRDGEVVERPADQTTLTKRYTEESVKFIAAHKDKPFLLYLAHTFPHVPMFASKDFLNRSRRGIYGDAVEELDWSVGEILKVVKDSGLEKRTLVFFTSDNGPWLSKGEQGGSAGMLREGKASTWEGGLRVPGIAWMPGRIKPGVTTMEMVHAMDLLPTMLAMAGCPPPPAVRLDGADLSALLFEGASLPPRAFFYYRGDELFACRRGEWKIHLKTHDGFGKQPPEVHDPPLLFHLGRDPGEQRNVAKGNANVIEELLNEVKLHQAGVQRVTAQLD